MILAVSFMLLPHMQHHGSSPVAFLRTLPKFVQVLDHTLARS